jgi:hypothetical protein
MPKQAKPRRRAKASANRNPAGKQSAPVSLFPLSFEEAMSGLAQVRMPSPDSKKPKAKPAKGK